MTSQDGRIGDRDATARGIARRACDLLRRVRYHDYAASILRSGLLARLSPFWKPAVLLLGYPRSGSSWAGALLGASPDLAYMNEPMNRSLFHAGEETSFIDPWRDEAMLRTHERLADMAFSGIPPTDFREVIRKPRDFYPGARGGKRLLIKEVNPLAAGFYRQRHAPQVVMLLRHPAAVMSSFRRLGWPEGENLEENAHLYGVRMAGAIEACQDGSMFVVRYEDLVADIAGGYHRIWEFLQVRPPADLDALVQEYGWGERSGDDPYDIRRNSAVEAAKWRRELDDSQVRAIRRGYLRSGLEYYRDEAEWA